jgi:MFS family permease
VKPPDPPARLRERAGFRAWSAIGLLGLATVFGYMDRQILVLVEEPLKRDLTLRDVQIGAILGLGPAAFAAIAGIPLGWLADRSNRMVVLALCVLLWSAFTAACGLAVSFQSLLVCAVGIAVGEAALGPIIYSLIPDLFVGSSRITANLLLYGIVVLGAGMGLIAGGAILGGVEVIRPTLPPLLRTVAGWRLTFFAVALPGPLIAAAIMLIPSRRKRERASAASVPARLRDYFRGHARTAAGVYLGGGFLYFAGYAGSAWLPGALVRALGVTPQQVSVGIGSAYIVGAAVGITIAMLGSGLWRRIAGPHALLRALELTMAASIVPTVLLAQVASAQQAYWLIGMQGAMITAGSGFSPAVLQDMAPPALRARLLAINSVVGVAVGASSPLLVGLISDQASDAPRALLRAVIGTAVLGFALAALTYRLTERPFSRTVAALGTAS